MAIAILPLIMQLYKFCAFAAVHLTQDVVPQLFGAATHRVLTAAVCIVITAACFPAAALVLAPSPSRPNLFLTPSWRIPDDDLEPDARRFVNHWHVLSYYMLAGACWRSK